MVHAFGFTTLRGHHPQHGLLSVLGILTCCTSLQCSCSFNGSGSFIATWPELQWWRNRELAIISIIQLWEFWFSEICHDLEVSSNRGTPKSSICRWIFHEINQPAIGDPHLWESSFLRFFFQPPLGKIGESHQAMANLRRVGQLFQNLLARWDWGMQGQKLGLSTNGDPQ